jgi:hypothetical protein
MEGAGEMGFIQIIDGRTARLDEVQAMEGEWERATEGKRTLRRAVVGRDRGDPEHFMVLAFFDSYESAMVNSNLPETDELGRKQASLLREPPTFVDLDVIEDHSYADAAGGGGLEARSFDQAQETRRPDKTTVQIVELGSAKAARMTLEPGWRWSECIKPVVGTESCQARHIGTVVSGRLHVVHTSGQEVEVGPGDAYRFEPGHDAWVVGDEPFVGLEFEPATVTMYAATPDHAH